MQQWFRFKLTGLFLVTLIAALLVKFWVIPIPEGLRSAEYTNSDGSEAFSEYFWYDKSTAVVEQSFNMDGATCWTPHNIESGQGAVAYLSWGSRVFPYYTIMQIQLPEKKWQTFATYQQVNHRICNFAASGLNCRLLASSFVPAHAADNIKGRGMTISRGPRGFWKQ